MERLRRLVPPLRVSRLVGALLVGLSVVAGYLVADWWWGSRDTTALARICARVDYVNLQKFAAMCVETRERSFLIGSH
jgi:hypothetical protein